MKLDALKLAVEYYCNLPASVPNNPNLVIDTANMFMVFLKEDDAKADNPTSGSVNATPKTLNLKATGQSPSGSK